MTTLYTIGDAGKQVGLTTKTIRYYESIGLLSSSKRHENNYRMYTQADIQILSLIVEVKRLGLPLSEIKTIVRQFTDEGCSHVATYLRTHLPIYLEKIRSQMTELEALQKRLSTLQQTLDKTDTDNCRTCEDPASCVVINTG